MKSVLVSLVLVVALVAAAEGFRRAAAIEEALATADEQLRRRSDFARCRRHARCGPRPGLTPAGARPPARAAGPQEPRHAGVLAA